MNHARERADGALAWRLSGNIRDPGTGETASVIAWLQRRRANSWQHGNLTAYPLLIIPPDLGLFVLKLGQSLQQSFRYRLVQDIGAQPG